MAKTTKTNKTKKTDEIVNLENDFDVPTIEDAVESDSQELADGDNDDVKVNIPVHIKLAGKKYAPGVHVVKRHQIPTIQEICAKKKAADISIFVGNNYIVTRHLDNSLNVIKGDVEKEINKK